MKNKMYLSFYILLFLMLNNARAQQYPWPASGCTQDPYCFVKRHCTSFVGFHMNTAAGHATDPTETDCQLDYPFRNWMCPGSLGHARDWNECLASIGYVVNGTPRVGAIAHWEANMNGAGSKGHVGLVIEVNADNTVDIIEYNWDTSEDVCGYEGTRYNVTPTQYIHYVTSDHIILDQHNFSEMLYYRTYHSLTLKGNTIYNGGDLELWSEEIKIKSDNVVKNGGRLVGYATKAVIETGNGIKVEEGGYSRIIGLKDYGISANGQSDPRSVSTEHSITANSIPAIESINKATNIDLTIFPNPVSNELTIQVHPIPQETVIAQIYNGVGQLMLTKEFDAEQGMIHWNPIIRHWPDGIYFLKVQTSNCLKRTEKIVKSTS